MYPIGKISIQLQFCKICPMYNVKFTKKKHEIKIREIKYVVNNKNSCGLKIGVLNKKKI